MLTVMVVDDDKRMVETISDILIIKGFETILAYSGEEAIELLKTATPDCVLMDNKMGGITGVEAYKIIKEMRPELPVIFMTAYETKEMTEACNIKGAYATLSKPINLQMLLSFLSSLRKTTNILIVDDNQGFCDTLKDILTLRDYHVECFTAPQKMLGHTINNNVNHVLILDLKLGEISGIDVLKEVKIKYPEIPIILVTGHRFEMMSEMEEGLKLSAYTCLCKPLEIDNFISVIKEIGRKKLTETLGVPFKKD